MIVLMLTYRTSFLGLLVAGPTCWNWMIDPKGPFPLTPIFQQIQAALDARMNYMALIAAVSVPDICSTLEWDPNPDPAVLGKQRRSQTKRYKDWFDTYLADQFNDFTADDCHSIRCGMVHQGQVGRPDDRFDRIAFLLDHRKQFRMEGNVAWSEGGPYHFSGNTLGLGLQFFCDRMAYAAQRWWDLKWADPYVRANLPNLVRERPEGFPPFLPGPLVG